MSDSILDKLESWQREMDAYIEPVPTSGLPKIRLGVHWISDLYRQSDLEYMAALRPPVIKIINPSPDRAREAFQRIDPNGHVALRYHPISEQHAEAQADPVGTAKRHAKYWIDQLNGPYATFDRSRLYVMGLNEPPVHNDAEERRQAFYTETWLKELLPHGIRSYVFNFSVGWVREANGRMIWDNFLYLEDLINQSNSFGCVHEYWYPNVMSGWGSYGNRISRCPMKIKFIIGECGYTRQLAQLPQPWGWDGNISADQYAAMLWDYADKVDPGKVFAVLPFTTSYGGVEWQSKDTTKAHGAILARKHSYVWSSPFPSFTREEVPPVETVPDLIVFPKYTGRISGYYGSLYTNAAGGKYAHEGLDISVATGTPIYAPSGGVVAFSGTDALYGEYIRTYHPALNVCFFFAHLSERLVQSGNSLAQGQLIGRTGSTGNSTGPHLHFEVRQMDGEGRYQSGVSANGNSRLDPLAWLSGWLSAGNRVEER